MTKKIAIVGFADSRTDAPYGDKSWEIWGVNDVYAYVPRVDVTFEVHHLTGLGNRRNPQHEHFLRTTDKPVWMVDPRDFPTAKRVPFEDLVRSFPRQYLTNSISIMLAMAILEIKQAGGGEIGVWGVDMAADTEYGSQRPSCEYYVGICDGAGIPLYIPPNSDLCKATAVYGIATTAPLRIKLQSRVEALRQKKVELLQQQAQLQANAQAIEAQLHTIRGQMDMAKHIMTNWTMPTDITTGEVVEAKDRGEAMEGSPLAATHTGNGHPTEPVTITVGGAQNG